MQFNNLTPIIIDIQKQLVLKPYDLAHDITHHYRVYQRCIEIINNERLKADTKIITLSAWLHDLKGRRGEKLNEIKRILRKFRQNEFIIKKVTNIVREHSFGKNQNTLESMILYDADKLEYVDLFRLSWFIQASEDGNISVKKYTSYKREWWGKVDRIVQTLHFLYSKKTFINLLPEAKKIMSGNISKRCL